MKLEILELKEVWTDELKRRGDWVVANIDTSIAWPVRVQELPYDGWNYWTIPVTRDAFPGIAARADGISRDELRKRILRFLSVISWVEGKGAVLEAFSGGSLPHSIGRGKEGGYVIRDGFDLPYLPVIDSERAKLALALMREGRGLSHPAYSFLSFFRAIEVAVGDGPARRAWMPDVIGRLENMHAKNAVAELKAEGVADIALHLFESGRCAIAHANADPIIDPDDPADSRRLYRELPIIESLAEMAIEEELDFKTSMTVYREHHHELAGFKAAFADDHVEKLIRGDAIPPGTQFDLPTISVRLRGKPPFPALEGLVPLQLEQIGSRALLIYGREDGSLQAKFYLNFAEERLEFDIYEGVFGISDDDSAAYADRKADLIDFQKWYLLNGSLEIVDTESGKEIARKDAFIPVNVIVQPEGFDKEIELWRGIAETRRGLEMSGSEKPGP
ncbi:MAG: hypothetical protein GY791_16535 [Alphaproteobacteria bacterium]|nr:hypothetical protein [Alphaproteobacteria bacterium]